MIATQEEVKAVQTAFREKVESWKAANPDWEKSPYWVRALEAVKAETAKGYNSALPKFFSFLDRTPTQIIEDRAVQSKSDSPDTQKFYEDKMRDFKTHLMGLHYKGTSIKTNLGYVAGFFKNNGYELTLAQSFYNEKDESDSAKATDQGLVMPPSNEEVRKVYAVADIEAKGMILYGYQVGFNPVDTVDQTWDRIGVKDWETEDRDFIAVAGYRGKTKFDYLYVVGPDLKWVLTQLWIKQGKPQTGYIFAGTVERDGQRYTDNSIHYSPNKVNDKIATYVNQVLSGDRAKNFTAKQLRQSFNAITFDIADEEIRKLLMGHSLGGARDKYFKRPDLLVEPFKTLYKKLTVNGWLYKEKAAGFDILSERLDTEKEERIVLGGRLEAALEKIEQLIQRNTDLRRDSLEVKKQNLNLIQFLVKNGLMTVEQAKELRDQQ